MHSLSNRPGRENAKDALKKSLAEEQGPLVTGERQASSSGASSSGLGLLGHDERVSRAGITLLMRAPKVGQIGNYELLGRLAFGGMAEIFLARESGPEASPRLVVIKRVLTHVAADPRFVGMFQDEARLAMHLQHPNICHVYAFGMDGNTPYLVMEWVNGMPLSKIIRRARSMGGMDVAIAVKVASHVADALDAAHHAIDPLTGTPLGIVHRDVSPHNIMIGFDGVVKLLDFGIAKASIHSNRTEAGVIKGKFAYMAPEQCLGESVDGRADVFALGICLYEMIEGTNPFRRSSEFDTMRAIVYEEPLPLRELRPDISPELEAIVHRALAKRVEDRFASAGEMHLALEEELLRMGEVVPGARIAKTMRELFTEESRSGPKLETDIGGGAGAEALASSKSTSQPNTAEPRATSSALVPKASISPHSKEGAKWKASVAVAGVVILALGVVGGMVALRHAWSLPEPHENRGATSAPKVGQVTGSMLVESEPPGAKVWIDGASTGGPSPFEWKDAPPGRHVVRVEESGYLPFVTSVDVRPGERTVLRAVLVKETEQESRGGNRPEVPPTRRRHHAKEQARGSAKPDEPSQAPSSMAGEATLSLNTRPWSKVYLGSRLLGTTPIGNVAVPAGRLELRLIDRDGNEHRKHLELRPGEHERLFFDLSTP
ncbi:MAG: serine/threonine-protein kinase [Sandaracinaceae bacterium]|nr:serine/threonine-protein kinase [Sandaracinaceae bacterium]